MQTKSSNKLHGQIYAASQKYGIKIKLKSDFKKLIVLMVKDGHQFGTSLSSLKIVCAHMLAKNNNPELLLSVIDDALGKEKK